jgi:hypothetical protein
MNQQTFKCPALTVLLLSMLASCTYVAVQGSGSHDVVVQPANLVPLLAAQDTVLADRAADQDGTGGLDLRDAEDINADQDASSVPTLTIPLTDGPPVKVPLKGVDPGEALQRAGGIVSTGHLPEIKDEADKAAPTGDDPENVKEENKDEQNQ